jgi:hypothetical protein
MMQDQTWFGCVEVLSDDGVNLGEATLRLRHSVTNGAEHWQAELRAPVTPLSIAWPDDRPVRLKLAGDREATAWLQPTVREVGPTLIQRAHVQAENDQFYALVSRL